MFANSIFNQPLNNWKLGLDTITGEMFSNCPFTEKAGNWWGILKNGPIY
jgi:hypothetical protein